jgi:hypothetical protein
MSIENANAAANLPGMCVNVSRLLVPCCLAVGLTLSSMAFADVAPPDDYVETCTIAKKQTDTIECRLCSAYYDEASRCETLLQPYCYVKFCNTYGASVWDEVWCRTKSDATLSVPSDIVAQLSTTDAPVVADAGAAGAANCPETPVPVEDSTNGSGKSSSSGCSLGPSGLHGAGCWGAIVSLLGIAVLGTRRWVLR